MGDLKEVLIMPLSVYSLSLKRTSLILIVSKSILLLYRLKHKNSAQKLYPKYVAKIECVSKTNLFTSCSGPFHYILHINECFKTC